LLTRIPTSMFVTCFYAILEPKSGRLAYANAGHDLPYLRRHSGNAEELRARGMPLGLMPGMGYEENETFSKLERRHCSTPMGWWRPTTPKARCSASPVCRHSSQSTLMRRGRWRPFSWRSFTPSLERAGSRRTTSPSLHSDVQVRTAELRRARLPRGPYLSPTLSAVLGHHFLAQCGNAAQDVL
jgi:hypothetical protein